MWNKCGIKSGKMWIPQKCGINVESTKIMCNPHFS
jgi:hypothetical protein